MAQDREFKFITGVETSTLPTATTPVDPEDLVTKQYADATYALAGGTNVVFTINGAVNQLYEGFDGWHRATANRTFLTIALSADDAGTGTTTVQIERWSGGPSGSATASANLTGGPGTATTKTTISLAVVDGDMIQAKLTALASGVKNLRVEVL